jgi:hypothetical protein
MVGDAHALSMSAATSEQQMLTFLFITFPQRLQNPCYARNGTLASAPSLLDSSRIDHPIRGHHRLTNRNSAPAIHNSLEVQELTTNGAARTLESRRSINMKIPVLVLVCLLCGNAFADGESTLPSSGSVAVGAQRALGAAFGGLSVPAITLGALLWTAAVTSAKSTTGTTGTN